MVKIHGLLRVSSIDYCLFVVKNVWGPDHSLMTKTPQPAPAQHKVVGLVRVCWLIDSKDNQRPT